MAFLSEAAVELALLEQLVGLGYSIEREEDIGPDGHRPERESHDEVVLKKRFEDAVARLNPGLPLEARQDAVRRVMQSELPSLLEENRRAAALRSSRIASLKAGQRQMSSAQRMRHRRERAALSVGLHNRTRLLGQYRQPLQAVRTLARRLRR